MPGRRKTHLQITDFEEEDVGFECEGGPILSGDGSINEDLVCGRCHRTLFLALSREAIVTEFAKRGGHLADRHGRWRPLVATCDCGTVNRVWPPPID